MFCLYFKFCTALNCALRLTDMNVQWMLNVKSRSLVDHFPFLFILIRLMLLQCSIYFHIINDHTIIYTLKCCCEDVEILLCKSTFLMNSLTRSKQTNHSSSKVDIKVSQMWGEACVCVPVSCQYSPAPVYTHAHTEECAAALILVGNII